jgi:hypothetical protein
VNKNDPDLVQAFLKKWWVESDFKAPNLPLSLRFKVSGCISKKKVGLAKLSYLQNPMSDRNFFLSATL